MSLLIVCSSSLACHLLIQTIGRLKFLDSTLERIIQRFEDEYPECRIPKQSTGSPQNSTEPPTPSTAQTSFKNPFHPDEDLDADVDVEDGSLPIARPKALSRHDSEVSIANRHLVQEEAQMHRFGQQVRRELLRPQTEDYHWGTTGQEEEAKHIQSLREKLEALSGSEIRQHVGKEGIAGVLKAIDADAEALRRLHIEDPKEFQRVKEAQEHAYAVHNLPSQESSPLVEKSEVDGGLR
jgi:hypothetical protein